MKNIIAALLATLFCSTTAWCQDKSPDLPTTMKDGEAMKISFSIPKKLNPGAANILMIGDSILGNYIKPVEQRMGTKANFYCRGSAQNVFNPAVLPVLQTILTAGINFDVIHFNEAGLHAWGTKDAPEVYVAAVAKYVATIRQYAPKAKIIWASTTPMTVLGHPDQLDPVADPNIVARNQALAQWMKSQNIQVDDLYALMLPNLKLGKGDRFHWTEPANEMMADAVTASLNQALSSPAPATTTATQP